MLANSYPVALLLTVLTETSVAIFLGYRKRNEVFSVILVNLLTQPALGFCLFINNLFNLAPMSMHLILLLETIVVLVEWQLLRYALARKPEGAYTSLLVLSTVMNSASLIIGLALLPLSYMKF